jgi:hypothetical protein
VERDGTADESGIAALGYDGHAGTVTHTQLRRDLADRAWTDHRRR